MYFQFLIEDQSTGVLVDRVMEKLQARNPNAEIFYDKKTFTGIGHLRTKGNLMERKGGNLLNNLMPYLRGFDKKLQDMPNAAIIIVLDNDNRDPREFSGQLNETAQKTIETTDHVFCIAVKEMEAWLLGDEKAIERAYPQAKFRYYHSYVQDGICDTWEVLADMLYKGGLSALRKKAGTEYGEIGRVKMEWADKIGAEMDLSSNRSPSFRRFVGELNKRITLWATT